MNTHCPVWLYSRHNRILPNTDLADTGESDRFLVGLDLTDVVAGLALSAGLFCFDDNLGCDAWRRGGNGHCCHFYWASAPKSAAAMKNKFWRVFS